MKSTSQKTLRPETPAPPLLSAATASRDWFLRNSHWDDVRWVLAPTNAHQEDRPIIIRWDFSLPNGLQFTDDRYATLRENSKRHLALIRTGFSGSRSASSDSRSGCGASTLADSFQCLRALIRWMIAEGVERFGDLSAALVGEFIRSLRRRPGYGGRKVSQRTLNHYDGVLIRLYRHRHRVSDALQVEPVIDFRSRAATPRNPALAPYTPDAVAIPLVQGAIEFLSIVAVPVLAARERYIQAYQRICESGITPSWACRLASAVLRECPIHTSKGPHQIDSARSLSELIELLYGACCVVISYLVGPRVSELMSLQAGCIQLCASPNTDSSPHTAMIVGTIYKQESYHGRPHQWAAPTPALHAIAVLEALSAPHRLRSGRQNLWLRPTNLGAREWLPDAALKLRPPDFRKANSQMNGFASWLQLPDYKGRPWKLASHQGRRTFARFVALRDRTALHALAQHLGHRDVRQTDGSYVGTDYQLNEEIEGAILDQSISAWEQMLKAPALGGRMGAEVLARRPRFRGSRAKQDIRAYARMLAEAGLTLGVCEWGYCVYREEFSACHGTSTAPNPVLREPSTCLRCKNFTVTDVHRPYWTDQVERYERLLNNPNLPTQTLKIARARLEEARSLLRSMESHKKKGAS